MSDYQRVLAAVDLSKEADIVISKARSLADAYGSELHLVHVLEPVVGYGNDNIIVDLSHVQRDMEQYAKNKMAYLAQTFDIPTPNQHFIVGNPAPEIKQLANKIAASIIVIGTHGQRGFSLLLGSTANSILHGTQCDILAVRIFPEDK